MGKKKKSIFYYIGQIFVLLYRLLEYLVKGVYYILKGIVTGITFIVNKITNRKKENKIEEKTTNEVTNKNSSVNGSIKSKPIYESFREIKTIKGNYEEFENKILENSSTIGIILGARGTGKSALGMKLLENFKEKTEREVYAMGFNPKELPNWINMADSVDDVKNNSVLLVDESGIQFSSRESMSNANKLLSQILFIARHKDLSIIFISQNSSNIEVNTIRQADYIALKPSSLLQKDFERKKIKEIYEEVEKEFEKYKEDKGLTYIYSHNYKGFVSNPLPSFWNTKVSKAYEKFKK